MDTVEMTFNLPLLFMAAFSYLLLLFFIAYATDQGWLPRGLARHPLTFTLSLGVYATTWTYYGSVGFAASEGYNFLTIYIGVTFAFLLTPVLLMPILRLTRDYQLTSLADLFAFRYRSQFAGVLVTLFMLVGLLPYMALQIRAVTESLYIVSKELPPETLALWFCIMATLFAILFGARHVTPREKHEGLVVAIAFESAVKLVSLLAVGATALFGVWGGPGELSSWLTRHPEALEALYAPVREGPWGTLLLLAFAAAFLLPRQFHMMFTENIDPKTLKVAAWAFPAILLLLNLPIPLVLWAGQSLNLDMPPDYYVLGVALAQAGSTPLPVLAFIGGISAASAMMIVTTLALASMCLNHLLLPARYPDLTANLYRWLLWGRRGLIALIIAAGYGFYRALEHKQGLVQLGLISFVAVAQFLPGIVGLLFWPRATRTGFIAGLCAGIAVWTVTLLLPLLEIERVIQLGLGLERLHAQSGLSKWEFATLWSLTANGALFVVASLLRQPGPMEREAAAACVNKSFAPPGTVAAVSPVEFKTRLARIVGQQAADKEVRQALNDLSMDERETRRDELRRLRQRLERNLSGLVGPQLAHMIVTERLELTADAQTALADTMHHVEKRLADSRQTVEGLAAVLDDLHRYHRQILLELPLGVCALSPTREVVLWNFAMESLSGVVWRDARGCHIDQLPAPWNTLLGGFVRATDNHVHRMHLDIGGRRQWFNLHKGNIVDPGNVCGVGAQPNLGMVVLLEDLTGIETLEAELAHSERLASVGRLAAGVAHEIGNPVTGIACLAQNLRDESTDAEVSGYASQILEQTQRISNVVRSLISFSHGGGQQSERNEFNLRDAIGEAARFVRLSREGKKIECVWRCGADLTAYGDRQGLVQVLVNLLINACDASRPGDHVEVDAQRVGDMLGISVRDYGEGIPADNRARIFEPFFTTKRPGEGTGLGLPLVAKIVRDHGGNIEVESEQGKGTRITVLLPQGAAASAVAVGAP